MAFGVFDSGIGGLTVYKELIHAFNKTDLIYLGDTARVPYGNKSPNSIIRYSLECAGYLVNNYNINALVVACNTISSYALEELTDAFHMPVLGVIQAGAERALKATVNGKIGVIGTLATIRSRSYINKLKELDSNLDVMQKACPLFAPLVEEGIINGNIPESIVRYYLDELAEKGIDTLILACTHYPLLAPLITKNYPELNVVDSASTLVRYLQDTELALNENSIREILITDYTPAFESLKSMLVGDLPIKTINL